MRQVYLVKLLHEIVSEQWLMLTNLWHKIQDSHYTVSFTYIVSLMHVQGYETSLPGKFEVAV